MNGMTLTAPIKMNDRRPDASRNRDSRTPGDSRTRHYNTDTPDPASSHRAKNRRAMEYLAVKWLHILSSTVLFGTGIGSAFYLLCVSLQRDSRTVCAVVRWVVVADWVFTTPAVVV